MKAILAFFIALGLFVSVAVSSVSAYTTVRGYFRSNGTYVNSYVRSNLNGIRYDNYSYKPSQPLYNTSYFTTGHTSSYYTPSYYTDSSYYTGKNIYNSYRY